MNNKTIQNNPFSKVKTRSIIYWFILATPLSLVLFTIIGIWLNLPELIRKYQIDFEDPLFISIGINLWIYLPMFLWLLYYRARTKLNLKYLLGKTPSLQQYSHFLLIIIPLILFSAGSIEIIYYLLFLINPEIVTNLMAEELLLTTKDTSYPLLYNILQFFLIVIVAPLVEEFLFRGIFLHRWSTKWSVLTAIITSSLVFGCLHLNPVGASIFGLIMSLVYLKTKSLLISIMIHFLNNLLVIVISLFSLLQPTIEANQSIEQIHFFWWQGSIALLVSLPWLTIFIRNNWQFTHAPLPYFTNRENFQQDIIS